MWNIINVNPQKRYSLSEQAQTVILNSPISVAVVFTPFWGPSVKFWRQNSMFPKIGPKDLFFWILHQKQKNTSPLEGNLLWPFAKRFRFGFNFLQLSEDFWGKCHTLSKIGQLNVRAWGSPKKHIFEARVLPSYINLHCILISWVVSKELAKTVRKAIFTGEAHTLICNSDHPPFSVLKSNKDQ